MTRILLMITVIIFACGFNVRDQPERFSVSGSLSGSSAPRSMTSEDQLWKTFAQCKLRSNKDFSYDISYSAAVKAMSGKEITISGFMLPLETKPKSSHFLLERRAPTCAFCPPGEPNEVIEVFSTKPMAWNENLVTMSGTLTLPNDGKKGVFFQMKDAVAR